MANELISDAASQWPTMTAVHKYRCTIGNDAFIGCNTNLVAPVNIGSNGYTAAGSTITEDVPDEALAIARAKQVNKPGYNQLLRGKNRDNG